MTLAGSYGRLGTRALSAVVACVGLLMATTAKAGEAAPPATAAHPPAIALGPRAEGQEGVLELPLTVSGDDLSGEARITLDLGRVDRRFGLIPAPDSRAAMVLPLSLDEDGTGVLCTDVSRHPWAGRPVQLELVVRDGAGREGRAGPVPLTLPERRFFDPMAAALIEMRRDLLWSRANVPRVAQILRALIWTTGAEDPPIPQDALTLVQQAIAGLERGDGVEPLAQKLWDAALLVENGGLAEALNTVRRAQERLAWAIGKGVPADEIDRLMADLSRAARDAVRKQSAAPLAPENRTAAPLDDMVAAIDQHIRNGRMVEAAAALEALNKMLSLPAP